ITNLHNLGYGRSLKNGIAAAIHDTICIIDGDLTYPADRIPELYEEHKKGFDLVVGSRTGSNFSGILAKGPLRWILRHLVEFAAGRPVPDPNSGLRVFSKSTIRQLEPYLCDTFSFTTSMTLGYMRSSKFVKHIPIEYHDRHGQTNVKLFKDSLRTLQYIVQAILYYNPMKIFTLFSALCILMSLIGFLVGMITNVGVFYYLSIGSLLISIIMFGFGLLADLLRQILNKSVE
ncbi:MAG: glycosyltransferase, partial [Hyphomicrobiales bacterium]